MRSARAHDVGAEAVQERQRLLGIGDNDETRVDLAVLELLARQAHVSGIVLDKEDLDRSANVRRLHGGLDDEFGSGASSSGSLRALSYP
jgi:hypothetical protein